VSLCDDHSGHIAQVIFSSNNCLIFLNSRTSWSPVYSTSLQEHSLQGLYDRLDHIGTPTTPVLMLIKDKRKRVFGALLPANIYWYVQWQWLMNTDEWLKKISCKLLKNYRFIHRSAVPYEIDHVNMFHCSPFKNFHGLMEHRCIVRSTSEQLSISDPEYVSISI